MCQAAVLACGPGAALCSRCAAAHRGLRPSAGARIDVAVPSRSTRRRRGIKVHRFADLRPDEVELHHAIPCTTLARTLLDLAAVLRVRAVERAINEALILTRRVPRSSETVATISA